jgi:membrane-associated phospholipid phosphatase
MKRVVRAVIGLRPEEIPPLLFFIPSAWFTGVAYVTVLELEGWVRPRYVHGIYRLVITAVLMATFFWLVHRKAHWPYVAWLRDIAPFLFCISVYTNLHDTIGFVNPHDVHHYLAALDRMIFGVQPCVWAERLITPARTEAMQFFYLGFFWIAPSTSLVLLLQRRWPEFRASTVGVIACFFMGYALYVVFPAAPPRLVLVYEFTRSLRGYPLGFSNLSAQAFALLPVDSRAAFPSLHAAASTVALLYAWSYVRRWFWVALPFAVGLWASTIYLRHHYFVDLVAGWLLAPAAVWAAPRLDAWWARQQRALGYEPARGAA